MRTSYTYGLLATILAALSIAGIAMAQNASSTSNTTNGSTTAPYYAPPGNNGSTPSTSSSTNNNSVINSSSTSSGGTTTTTGSTTSGTSQPQYGPFIVPSASTSIPTTTGTNAPNTGAPTTIGVIVYPSPGMTPAAMVLRVDDFGTALIRGIVQSISPGSVTIQSWGGTWTLTTATGSTVIPQGTNGSNDLSALRVGDFVGAIGTISQTQPYTINASLVRDWTTNPFKVILRVTPTVRTNTTTNSTATTSAY